MIPPIGADGKPLDVGVLLDSTYNAPGRRVEKLPFEGRLDCPTSERTHRRGDVAAANGLSVSRVQNGLPCRRCNHGAPFVDRNFEYLFEARVLQ